MIQLPLSALCTVLTLDATRVARCARGSAERRSLLSGFHSDTGSRRSLCGCGAPPPASFRSEVQILGEDRPSWPECHLLALVQPQGSIAESLDEIEIVRGHQHRPTRGLRLAKESVALLLEAFVPRAEGLVNQEQVAVDVNGDGEGQPSPHARRQCAELGVDEAFELRPLDDLVETVLDGAARQATEGAVQVDVVGDRQLVHHADTETGEQGELPADLDPPARRRVQASDDLQQRGLARARSEEHTSELQSQSNLVCRLLLEKKNH